MYTSERLKRGSVKTGFGLLALCFILSLSFTACGRHGAPQVTAVGSVPDAAEIGRLAVEDIPVPPVKKEETYTYRPAVHTTEWPGCLQYAIDSLLHDDLFRSTQVGLCVYDLTADSMLFAYNHRQRLRPASTEKVITAVSALALLGGDYSFRTRLCMTGMIRDSVLCGDIYAVGGFDPCFDRDDMKAFVSGLKALGVDSIAGCFYEDVSMKDTLKWGWGWCWDDDNPTLTPLLYKQKDRFREAWFELLAEQGINTSGLYGRGICPEEARPVVTRTHSIDQVLLRMMKDSDNLYAEALFYPLAARSGKRYASRKEAVRQIHTLIEQMGFRPDDYQIADGSGLSLYNYLTPELEMAFLRYAYRNKDIYSHLHPSLPTAGWDGTLEKRMKTGPASLSVQAKTGTVEGVSALAGYATASNGHVLAFSIMNQGIVKARMGRDFQDKVCALLCR